MALLTLLLMVTSLSQILAVNHTAVNILLTRSSPQNRPIPDGGGATNIQMDMSILNVNTNGDGDFGVSMYFRMRWMDKRLRYDHDDLDLPHDGRLVLPMSRSSAIWKPDVFFPNEKSVKTHDVTVPNSMFILMADGTTIVTMRLTLTLTCGMSMTAFPMGSAKCPIDIESYRYSSDELRLSWLDDKIPEFKAGRVGGFNLDRTSGVQACNNTFVTGTFPCLSVTFHLSRNVGYYLLIMYIPTFLIVILSWLPFWLKLDVASGRGHLGMIIVLTMAAWIAGSQSALPRAASYARAIDVWMFVCFLFVFLAYIEYAVVNTLYGDWSRVTTTHDMDVVVIDGKQVNELEEKYKDRRHKASQADKISRFVFPIVFVVFNFIYWLVYCLAY